MLLLSYVTLEQAATEDPHITIPREHRLGQYGHPIFAYQCGRPLCSLALERTYRALPAVPSHHYFQFLGRGCDDMQVIAGACALCSRLLIGLLNDTAMILTRLLSAHALSRHVAIERATPPFLGVFEFLCSAAGWPVLL